MPMAKEEDGSGNPVASAMRKACAPATRQNTTQAFASNRAIPIKRCPCQADAARPASFMRSSRMPWAIRNASSSAWLALRRGSQAV